MGGTHRLLRSAIAAAAATAAGLLTRSMVRAVTAPDTGAQVGRSMWQPPTTEGRGSVSGNSSG